MKQNLFIGFWPIIIITHVLAQTSETYRIKSDSQAIKGSSIKKVTCEAHYSVSPETVWNLLNKMNEFPSYIPRVSAVESMGVSEQKEKLFIMMDAPWPLSDIWNILSLHKDPVGKRINWDLVDGNMKKNSGTFTVDAEGTGSVVRMDVSVELSGVKLPQWLIAWGAKKFLPKILVAIGKKLESNSSPTGK